MNGLMIPELQILDMTGSNPSDKNVQHLLIVVELNLKKLCLSECRSTNAPELEFLPLVS